MKNLLQIAKSIFPQRLWLVLGLTISSQIAPAQTFSIDITLADQGQQNTIAFDGLAFLTGNLESDSFFPPGKVADFWGFQYLRDNDPSEMGHNTSFLTSASCNMLNVLTASQRQQLVALANLQTDQINTYGYKRFVLMKAFRRLLEGDFPSGTNSLDREAVKAYSAELYRLDGAMSFQRARVMGNLLHSLTTTQKAYLDGMAGKGMLTWPVVEEPTDLRGLGQNVKVAVMTYAGDMFSWYAGSIEADVYFCPERQGTYFGSFYMKDAPAVGNPNYTIGSNITADYGNKFIQALSAAESAMITGLVDTQRAWLYEIVDRRKDISTELRKFASGGSADSAQVINLMDRYGELDGEISYNFATTFASVNGTTSTEEKASLAALRHEVLGDFSPTSAYLYSAPIAMPDIPNTDFLFSATFGITINASAGNVCDGTVVTYTATAINGGATPIFVWKVNEATSGTNSNVFSYTPSNSDVITCELIPNTSITVTDQVISNPITMTVFPKSPVSVSVTAGSNPVCAGTKVTFNATPTNGGTAPQYQWKVNGNDTGPNLPTFVFNPVNNDQVSCIMTSNLACVSGSPATSNALTMSVKNTPAQPGVISGPAALCGGTTGVTYTIVPVTGASGYSWSVPAGSAVSTGQGTTSITVAYGTDSGIVSVAASNTCGTGNSRLLAVTVNPAVPASITSTTPTTFCTGGSVVLTANSGTGYLYQWKLGGTSITGATKSSYTAKAAGSYTVMISKTGYCTGISAPVNVTVIPLPAAIIKNQGTLSICQGGSVVLLANTETQLTYQWKKDGVNIAGANSPGYKATLGGSYTVTETNSSGCASTSTAAKVSVNVPPTVVVSPAGPVNLVSGGSITLIATKVSGYSYQWYKNSQFIPGATANKYTTSGAGVYDVIISSTSTGCSTISNYVTVNTNGSLKSLILNDKPVDPPSITNYPNPFSDFTQLIYCVPELSHISLKIHNLMGKEVETLLNCQQEAGNYTIVFDAKELPAGTYFYTFHVKGLNTNYLKTGKLLIYK